MTTFDVLFDNAKVLTQFPSYAIYTNHKKDKAISS